MNVFDIYKEVLNENFEMNNKCKIKLNGIIYLLSILGFDIYNNHCYQFGQYGVESMYLNSYFTLKKDMKYSDSITFNEKEINSIYILKYIILSGKIFNITAWIQTLASVHYLKKHSIVFIVSKLFNTNPMFQNEKMIKLAMKIMEDKM